MILDYAALARLIVPEIIVVLTALAALVLNAGRWAAPRNTTVWLVSAGLATACLWIQFSAAPDAVWTSALAVNPLTQFFKQILLGLGIATVWISGPERFTAHIGEYFALLLLALVGMMFLISAENLLSIFVSLELISLSLYITVAFNKRSLESAEAALKYFLFGGVSAAFTLFGFSLFYGIAGGLSLEAIADGASISKGDPLLAVAIVMTLIGFGFKVAVAPFHLWAPDVYQGAPTASAAFIASGSKVASFVVLAKLTLVAWNPVAGSADWNNFATGWIPVLAIIAGASMIFGNLAALAQTSVRRLLAYSAIAHGGYALIGLVGNQPTALAAFCYYIITYAVTVLGAFAVVAAVEQNGRADHFDDFSGLNRTSPLLAGCLLVFILSLAGIPPLAGFFGKFFIFAEALRSGGPDLPLLWLVILAVATSVIALYYYLKLLKQVYVMEAIDRAPLKVLLGTKVTTLLLAVFVVVLGCLPELLIAKIDSVIQNIAH